jgi:hypothetical protein
MRKIAAVRVVAAAFTINCDHYKEFPERNLRERGPG